MRRSIKRVTVIGDGAGAAQCALVLARLGAEVTVLSPSLNLGSNASNTGSLFSKDDMFFVRPLLLQAISDPRIVFRTNTKVESIGKRRGQWYVRATRYPCYVRSDLCTGCGRCTTACSVQVPIVQDGKEVIYRAIHGPVDPGAIISAYSIEKQGIPPCSAACPLGINVQGFVSLLANGKVDAALRLIHEAAPLAGVLGRVCTHPCEEACKRREVDDPLFIKALHRYAADHASGEIQYSLKAPPGSRKEKIAIVGSGPAGLATGWELARRGYSPVIYESHAVVGGMLATGIPRFRLPREIREKEVKAIERMGVKIRTGVTIGRDVTIADLRERGYRAFFLAIGAHENRRLNIPGEDVELKGVSDCTSFLFELNYGEGVSVGRNMVVIGGGNSAIDSARTAMRKGKRKVTILYRRTATEMTAIKEDIEEALNEGVAIEYLTAPVEILHDGSRVTGVRCQRMRLGEEGPDGRRRPLPVPGSDFVMEADHVVLAIGQRPDVARLNLKALKIDAHFATVRVDPLTLETGIEGVFAGGDCVTGPNTVVDGVAQGLRAAESIDRYLRGRSVRKGRNTEAPEPVEVNVNEKTIVWNKRAKMPLIPHAMRMDTFEETNVGISPEMVATETVRCLNCAVCSGCMECERACELKAVAHDDLAEEVKVVADSVVRFLPAANLCEGDLCGTEADRSEGWTVEKEGVYTVRAEGKDGGWTALELASLVALEVSSQLNLRGDNTEKPHESGMLAVDGPRGLLQIPKSLGSSRESLTGVLLCNCGDSIGSVIDLAEVAKGVRRLPNVSGVHEISQACSEEGAREIAAFADSSGSTNLVLAACRCCNLREPCFNCNNRRVKCLQHMNILLPPDLAAATEYVNIREHCAWVHGDHPANATGKTIDLISAAAARKGTAVFGVREEQPIQRCVLILGDGVCGLTAAKKLRNEGCSVSVVSRYELNLRNKQSQRERKGLLNDVRRAGVQILSWPSFLDLRGSPGNFEVVLSHNTGDTRLTAGAVIVCLDEVDGENAFTGGVLSVHSLLARILRHRRKLGERGATHDHSFRESSFEGTSGIYVSSLECVNSVERRSIRGGALAAQVLMYFSRRALVPAPGAVFVNNRLCRGCESCATLCPLIEMRKTRNGASVAHVESTLCLGCGACIACCPTGAITEDVPGDEGIIAVMTGLLKRDQMPSEVTWDNL